MIAMRLVLSLILLGLMGAALAQMRATKADANTQAILNQARQAIGNTKIQSLAVKGKLRRFVHYVEVTSPTKVQEKDKTLTSKIEIQFLLPDKFRLKQKISQLNGYSYDYYSYANGKESWVYPMPPAPSSRSNARVVDVADVEKNIAQQEQIARSNLARFMMVWLLESLPAWPAQYSYRGQTRLESDLYDVILVEDADGLKTLLLLDQKTHLPALINETVIAPQPVYVVPGGFGFDRRYNRAIMMRVREERLARLKPPQPIAIQMRLSDRKITGGLNLPHRITTLHNGQPVEEIEFDEFEFNQPMDPNKFNERRPR